MTLRRNVRNLHRKFIKLFYKLKYDIEIGFGDNETMPYELGIGKYVDVLRKGNYIDIYNYKTNETIRLVPVQSTHGVRVELWRDDHLCFRTSCDFDKFKEMGLGAGERERIGERERK